MIKLGLLHRNGLLSSDEIKQLDRFKSRFRTVAMAMISFYEVDFSYDRNYLASALTDCHKCLQVIVSKHLTDKSLSRVDSVFVFFANDHFLDAMFLNSQYRETVGKLVADLNMAIDSGDI